MFHDPSGSSIRPHRNGAFDLPEILGNMTVHPSPMQDCQSAAGVITDEGFRFGRIHLPPLASNHARIRVQTVGICRTDQLVVEGQLKTARPMIPGHELSGVIAEIDSQVSPQLGFRAGQNVTINPLLPCESCVFCCQGQFSDCQNTRFVGVDLWGACGQYLDVPVASLHLIPPNTLPPAHVVFAEPVAASLAVLDTSITTAGNGVIVGGNRIAVLTQRILLAHGFTDVPVLTLGQFAKVPDHHFDFAIEAGVDTKGMNLIVQKLRPGATLVVKSRCYQPFECISANWLPKRPRLEFAHYGSFPKAIELLQTERVRVDDLVGDTFPLRECVQAFRHACDSEILKTMIDCQAT